MQSKARTISAITLMALVVGTATPYAYAADTKAPTAATASKDAVAATTAAAIEKDAQFIRTVDDAFRALREVRAARIAIFNGSPEAASELVSAASKDLQAAQMSAKDFAVATSKGNQSGDSYLPVDMSISLAEGFVATEEKSDKLKAANAHMMKGETKKAAEVLKLANIDVSVAAALIPANASVGHAKDAERLIAEKRFYEANLALKAIKDSVVVESYGVDSLPAQGKAG